MITEFILETSDLVLGLGQVLLGVLLSLFAIFFLYVLFAMFCSPLIAMLKRLTS